MKTTFTTQHNAASTLQGSHSTHNVYSPLRRLSVLVALLMIFALGARAASYVIYQNGYFLAINNNNNGIEATQNFNPSTCVWTGPNNSSSGYLQITRNKNTYYLNRANNGLSVSSNTNNLTTWNVSNGTIYTTTQGYWNRDYYITYSTNSWSSGWTTTENSSNVLYGYQSEDISASSGETTYTVSLESVTATPSALDYNNNATVTANGGSVTITTTNTLAHTKYTLTPNGGGTAIVYYSQDGSTVSTTRPVSSTTETEQPTSYTWGLSSTSNANLGSTTTPAASNTVIYNKSSSTDKQVTVTVKATYTVGGTTHESEAKSTTITLNRLRENPTNIEAEDLTLAVGSEESIIYTLTPADAHDDVRFVIANTDIATVDENGVVTAIKAGITTATVTAYKSDGTTNAALTTTCNVTVTPKAPTIEFSLGTGITATIGTTEAGAKIYYTINGDTPTESSTEYTAPFTVEAGVIVKAIVVVTTANGEKLESPVAESLANAGSGIVGNTVYLYDLEDHNWTYYQQSSNLPSGYPTTYLSSPNPRNVKITYRAGGVDGASAVAISALEGEGQNEMVYYKTLEKSVPGMSGDYPYTVISNPFSKRPKLNSTYYGFNGWKVVDGGEYISEHNDNDVLDLDETIHFTNLDNNYTPNCMSAEIVFEATWTEATVKTGNSAPSFTNGTYETNFWVLTGNPNNAITVPTNCTMTARYPDGSVSWDGNFTRAITAGGNNAKVEFVNMYSTGNVSAANYTFTMGRGIVNSGDGGELRGCTNSNADCIQTVKVESGKYASLSHFTAELSNARRCDQLMILGCDYDRAKRDNSKLQITGSMYLAYSTTINRASGVLFARSNIKSGTFQKTITGTYSGTAAQSYYFGCYGSSYRSAGHRYMLVEGGDIRGLCGGTDHTTNQQAGDPAFTLRIRGSENNPIINGIIYGAAENADCRGRRTMVLTGGTVKGWIAGGANGTASSGGTMTGATFVYVGGKANINSGGSQTVINRAVGGNVFAAGCGYGTNSSSGQVTLGTNVVVADDAYVERGVYGGGSYGYTTNTSNIYITGGRVGGGQGGVTASGNNASFTANIPGGVYGGACQNQGGTVNIYMTGGEVNGGLYGGSNNSGTIANDVTIQINGGQVGTSSKSANIHGGGYGQNTIVSGNIDITLGATGQKTGGVTVFGDVYGGSALGKVNGTAASDSKHTYVTLNKGTINGSIYGGGLGQKNGVNNATSNIAADVYGPVAVKVYGGSVKKVGDTDGSGGVYGANNIYGAPQRSVTVDIYGTDPTPAEGQYALYAVYGGGNNADYTYGNDYPKVAVHYCDNSIEYVYGGGNAAAVAATDVTIYGGNTIGNVFGGGNGTVSAANVTGNTLTKIYGGTILNVYGGSNSQGTIGGTISVLVDSQGEGEKDPCTMNIGSVYGGGNLAASRSGNIDINCTGENGYIENVFGGANRADITGNIDLQIDGGNIGNVFGGNNNSGDINGTITVTVGNAPNHCGVFKIGNVYGGGNLAAYSAPTGNLNFPMVNIKGGTVLNAVYGGGLGESAVVTGNPRVNVSGGTVGNKTTMVGATMITGDVFGGGSQAALTGNAIVTLSDNANVYNCVYGGGLGERAIVTGNPQVTMTGGTVGYAETVDDKQVVRGGDIFGGGNAAAVQGNTNVYISGGEVKHNVYGGGNQAKVTGKTNVVIGQGS